MSEHPPTVAPAAGAWLRRREPGPGWPRISRSPGPGAPGQRPYVATLWRSGEGELLLFDDLD